jgi:hypothetical protein
LGTTAAFPLALAATSSTTVACVHLLSGFLLFLFLCHLCSLLSVLGIDLAFIHMACLAVVDNRDYPLLEGIVTAALGISQYF